MTGNDALEQRTEQARSIAAVFSRLETQRRAWEQRTPLGVSEMRLLWVLQEPDEWTLRDIAEHLGLEQSTVNRQVNAAVAAGLVTKLRGDDQPTYQFRASDQGARMFESCAGQMLDRYQAALDELGDQADLFVDLLDRFVDRLLADMDA